MLYEDIRNVSVNTICVMTKGETRQMLTDIRADCS